VGLDAAECVNATIEAAQNRHYIVNLIDEAVLSKTKERKDSMLAVFRDRGVKIVHMDNFDMTK
jgi:nicotinamidase-related amidase